ncbi:unnamed protein product [Spirodela intermedia]|uniref:Uncharacterized protein n=2 Tax=Spirodela intermedia TaxID=51605 RepID=A0A7I8L104_SPIIN|nr:unnamed protein product [Spirodela intermedia]
MDADAAKPDGNCKGAKDAPTCPVVEGVVDGEESGDQESRPLLAASRRVAVMAKGSQRNAKRKVRWNDRHGNKLAEVLEFQPSDNSDSEADDYGDSCICAVM